MKRMFYAAVVLVAFFAASSCSKEEITEREGRQKRLLSAEEKDGGTNKYRISPENAKETLLDFIDQMEGQLRSGGEERSIQNVEFMRLSDVVHRSAEIHLKSGGEEGSGIRTSLSSVLDSLIYIINFKNEKGFAFMGADKRTSPIFAIIDEGKFSLEKLKENPGFVIFLERMVNKGLSDIKNYKGDSVYIETRNGKEDYEIHKYVKPKLKIRIWQRHPFNMYCPLKDGQHCLAGCVPVAMANIVSYFKGYNYVHWKSGNDSGETTMHWDQIEQDYINSNGWSYFGFSQSKSELAHLVRDLGNDIGATYGVKGTGGKPQKAVKWLRKYGKNTAATTSEWTHFKTDKMVRGMETRDALILMSATSRTRDFIIFNLPKGGHTWVIDGFIRATKKNSNESECVLLHCCFGWTDRIADGYYLGSTFDTTKGPIIKEDGDDSDANGDYNYKYFPEMSIVARNVRR